MSYLTFFGIDQWDLRSNSLSVGLAREKTAQTIPSQYLVLAPRQTFSIRWMCISDPRTVVGF